jgi:hypothetical protein
MEVRNEELHCAMVYLIPIAQIVTSDDNAVAMA